MAVLYGDGNANRIVLRRVRDPLVVGYIDDMTGTVTIFDQTGEPVEDATDIAIVYTPDSDGEYRATIPASARLIVGTKYLVVFQSDNYEVRLRKMMDCVERTG